MHVYVHHEDIYGALYVPIPRDTRKVCTYERIPHNPTHFWWLFMYKMIKFYDFITFFVRAERSHRDLHAQLLTSGIRVRGRPLRSPEVKNAKIAYFWCALSQGDPTSLYI